MKNIAISEWIDADIIEIDGITVARGEEKEINISIDRLPTRTQIDIPVYVKRAKEPGPVLLLLAGMHGDEINGVEVIRRMIQHGFIEPERGTIIAIPILNIYGFINFSRDVPDGKDINRSFPGSSKGSLAGRVAHVLMKKILPVVHCGVDFHTGGESKANYPQIRCKFDWPINIELANAFAAPFTVDSEFRENSLRQEASELGIPILVFEGGESLRFDEDAIDEAINGARRLMEYLKISRHSPDARHVTRQLIDGKWVRAESAGLFHAFAKNGTSIHQGQTIGMITDPFGFGDFEVEVKSPYTGHIIAVNNIPVINQGDSLFHIGLE